MLSGFFRWAWLFLNFGVVGLSCLMIGSFLMSRFPADRDAITVGVLLGQYALVAVSAMLPLPRFLTEGGRW